MNALVKVGQMRLMVMLLLGALVLGMCVMPQSVYADGPDKDAGGIPVYPSLVPPQSPAEMQPSKPGDVTILRFDSGRATFTCYASLQTPYKIGSNATTSTWQWTESGGSPFNVKQMETWTWLWWWNGSSWTSKASAYSKSTNTWRCQADASASGITGYWTVTGRWKGEAYSGDTPANWDNSGEGQMAYLTF